MSRLTLANGVEMPLAEPFDFGAALSPEWHL